MHKANERTHATLHSLREPSRLTVEGVYGGIVIDEQLAIIEEFELSEGESTPFNRQLSKLKPEFILYASSTHSNKPNEDAFIANPQSVTYIPLLQLATDARYDHTPRP